MTEIAPFITPGTCPFGVVVRIVDDHGTILSEQHIEVGTDTAILDLLAGAAADATNRAADENPELAGVTVVGYDGDSGELMMTAFYDRS